ncbi:uncharacterized protein LOC103514586 [Diaphorina citri]|uniref:Uncharacterized protein LOC103514586 n=1 Tax=Diaphorina citri TaxID=121845 RepID=A0A1S3DAB9_DIACI|nr:uncharacterized protein LOC103514586 [Diaphorina citri]KAI5711562.1 hypothetical protein M8J75_001392 [Diaphorina citri]KAI5754803.1 hypothetical protein M8J77_011620 [Diaphorina citri]
MRTCYNVSPKPAVQNTTPKSDENKKVITKKTILGRRYVKVPDTSLKQVRQAEEAKPCSNACTKSARKCIGHPNNRCCTTKGKKRNLTSGFRRSPTFLLPKAIVRKPPDTKPTVARYRTKSTRRTGQVKSRYDRVRSAPKKKIEQQKLGAHVKTERIYKLGEHKSGNRKCNLDMKPESQRKETTRNTTKHGDMSAKATIKTLRHGITDMEQWLKRLKSGMMDTNERLFGSSTKQEVKTNARRGGTKRNVKEIIKE